MLWFLCFWPKNVTKTVMQALVIWLCCQKPKLPEPSRPRLVIWLFGFWPKNQNGQNPAVPGCLFGHLVIWPKSWNQPARDGFLVLWFIGQETKKPNSARYVFGYLAKNKMARYGFLVIWSKKPEWPEPSRPGMVIWFFCSLAKEPKMSRTTLTQDGYLVFGCLAKVWKPAGPGWFFGFLAK